MAVIPDREAPHFHARKKRRERAEVTKPLHGYMLTSQLKEPTEYIVRIQIVDSSTSTNYL